MEDQINAGMRNACSISTY